MAYWISLVFLVFGCLYLKISNAALENRITGITLPWEYEPWFVFIQAYKNGERRLFGGGVFLSDRVVLTQAALVVGFDHWNASFGHRLLVSSHVIEISKTIAHPDFNSITFENDIALMLLESSTNDYALGLIRPAILFEGPIPLPTPDLDFLGFGYIDTEPFIAPPNLQKTYLHAITMERCRDLLGERANIITPTHLCALTAYFTSGVCNGDQGGPITPFGLSVPTLYGIVSVVTNMCNYTYPILFTNIPLFVDWINENVDLILN